ncbi:NADP-dependent oxidoreductase [Umezawaea tangerina]|uniref:NADP-dependent oxidoreductase n=1 Tax=Umezawaea tangerina TaxID=84725 RepID=UPI000ADFF7C0|nr:NADP-dependent oxidoreductase [Umezawaea tangerina]
MSRYGGFDAVEYREVGEPVPGPGEIRVRVAYVAVNAIEWKILAGSVAELLPQTFPVVLGNEVSGVVDHVGDGEHDLRVGDRVTGFVRGGGDAEYVLTTPDRVAVVPDGLSLRRAATIPQGVETARRAIRELGVEDGETVLVNGAAGSIGSAAVQLLVDRGVVVIGTARPDNHEYLRGLGAIPIEYGTRLLDQLAAAAPKGVDRALDCGSRGFVRQILPVVPADRVITVADFEAQALGVPITMGAGPHELYADSFRDVLPLAARGRFATEIAAEFPLSELTAAWKMNEDGHFRGKIVVKVAQLD